MTLEREIQPRVMLAICENTGATIFRNNVGMGWSGRVIARELRGIVLADARPLHAGLCRGSSDLIGWQPITITPEMVGRQVAVFLAVEVKTKDGRATPEQVNFIKQVRNAGGIGLVARSPEDAVGGIKSWFPRKNE